MQIQSNLVKPQAKLPARKIALKGRIPQQRLKSNAMPVKNSGLKKVASFLGASICSIKGVFGHPTHAPHTHEHIGLDESALPILIAAILVPTGIAIGKAVKKSLNAKKEKIEK